MANIATSKSIQELKNLSADQSVSPHIPREGMMGKGADGSWYNVAVNTDGSFAAPALAMKVETSGTTTYLAFAVPGSAQSSAVWQARKIDSSSGAVITWADGDASFDNVATDLTALTYS